MYALLILIHAIFIYASYMIGSYILLIFFTLSFFTLSFYFSPFFFSKQPIKLTKKIKSISAGEISQLATESILVPIILFYIAVYGIVYSIFGNKENILNYHTLIGSLIYLLFTVYYLVVQKMSDTFYELLRYHTILILGSGIVCSLFFGLLGILPSIFFVILFFFSLLFSLQILMEGKNFNGKDTFFYLIFLFSLSCWVYLVLSISHQGGLFFWAGVLLVLSLMFFFFFPRIKIFTSYEITTKYYSIVMVYISLILSYIMLYQNELIASFIIGSAVVVFLLYVHTQYENYISYFLSIVTILLLYSSLFSSLLVSSFSSALLFIFFLPATLIGSTYFIRQKYELDFLILHYSSIVFSVGFSLYYIFQMAPVSDLILFASFFTLGVSTLSFMSYFRFRHL